MRSLVLALYDLETPTSPPDVGGWDAFDKIGFAVGIVRYVRYTRVNPKEVVRATLMENVHFGPVPFLDDLLRPWCHAAVSHNGLAFDNPVAVHAAVDPRGAVYVEAEPIVVDVVAHELARAGLPPSAAVGVSTLPEEERTALYERMRLHRGHSRLILPGVAGIGATRHDVLEALNRKTFDTLAYFNELTGHPHVVRLDYLREGLELPEFMLDGNPVDGAAVPGMWQDGLVWQVVAKCRHDVNVLEELMHQGLGGGKGARVFANKVNTTVSRPDGTREACGHADAFRSPHADTGGKWAYHLPTGDWWERLEAIAQAGR